MNRVFFLGLVGLVIFLLDLYVFQAVKVLLDESSATTRKVVYALYWGGSVFTIGLFFVYNFTDLKESSNLFRQFALVWIFIHVFSKMFGGLFLLFDDFWRMVQWVGAKLGIVKEGSLSVPPASEPLAQEPQKTDPGKITRSEFLAKSALVATAVPVVTMGFGILSGAHDYRVHRHVIKLPNLPKKFDGLRIGQLSDIHSGSFFNKTAVKGGVEMMLAEKPDLIFFTGDLVNNEAIEVKEYIDVFGKIAAPLGVYSTLGNHDYGDYKDWGSVAAKKKNLQDLMASHKTMGWNLMMNENKIISTGGESIAVLGVENYGKGRFPKYGLLDKAWKGTEEVPVKLLLSHDPSHWDLEVLPKYKDIDLTFSGHTHGMQFGIEFGSFKWSPAQYMYPQWAGLYQQDNQYLYVNRGFGYLGYPGRIGILPEITIIELKSA